VPASFPRRSRAVRVRHRLLATLLAAACGASEIPEEPPFLRGRLTLVRRTAAGQRFLIEGTPGPGHREDRAYFWASAETRVLRRGGARATPDDLATGQTVSLWTEGVVDDTDPVQAGARVVVIEVDPARRP
jgi:hypothetical protein